MHIVYVGSVPPIHGGIAQHGGCLVQALREADHRVDVISWRAQYPRLLFKGQQVDVRRAPNPLDARFELCWWNPLSLWRAGRAAARADLLVFPWITPFQAPHLRCLLAGAGRTPSVAFVHNSLPHEPHPLDRSLTRWVLRRVGSAAVHAERLRDDLRELAGLEDVRVVGFPSQLALEPTPLPPSPPLRLVFLGFIRPYKGLATAVDALALLRARGRDVTLTVAGEFWDPPVEEWRARLARAQIEEHVTLVPGYASDEAIAEHLRTHHLLVAPYDSATQSGVVPLALAAGRGVVATNVGGLPERVHEGRNGTLAPPRDPAAFADAIERAAQRVEELAEAAAADQVSWAEVANAVTGGAPDVLTTRRQWGESTGEPPTR